MKKFILLTGFILLVFSGVLSAQPFQWSYVEDFVTAPNPHGVVIDPAGKIWVGSFGASDSLISAEGDTIPVSAIFVYNPDGTQVSFSPISVLTVGLTADTLQRTPPRRRCRGISLDVDGNILYSTDDGVYRIDYTNGQATHKLQGDVGAAYTEAAVDDNGFIYVTGVVPGGKPIEIYDSNFDLFNFAVDSNFTISRSILASPDGKDLYLGGIYPAAGVIHFHSDNGPDGTYAIVDTLFGPNPDAELWGQILDWDPAGRIWVGSYWDTAPGAYRGWYALDPQTSVPLAFQDSLGANIRDDVNGLSPDGSVPTGATFWAPRGIAFQEETDGSWTAYTADFDGNVIKKWTNAQPTGIILVEDGQTFIKDFDLQQNYPNPFNPSTKIPFALKKAANVRLLIYNVRGQLVKTLVDERLEAGKYEYEFNAAGLASGTYFYRVSFDGKLQTKQMMLLK